ncbi:MAG: 50S ribosomal protein L21 [Chloroflexi bacterium]|nr:50S ribosomal protein L21 [Chloroflexota bacterium]MDA1239877.1 50S ribosomal protein L21 [Chloroflexota bacterium]
MYAIIRTGGKQYRVRQGDRIAIERIEAEEGAEVTLSDVLLVGDEAGTTVGAPTVDGASVTALVEAHSRAKKVTYYDFKNKTRRERMVGHKHHQTELLITAITAG